MLGPALGEYNAASHLVWAVIYLLLGLLVVIFLAEILTNLYYSSRNRLRGQGPPATSADPSRGEGRHIEEPATALRSRHLHLFVPVLRNWFEGRCRDPRPGVDRLEH